MESPVWRGTVHLLPEARTGSMTDNLRQNSSFYESISFSAISPSSAAQVLFNYCFDCVIFKVVDVFSTRILLSGIDRALVTASRKRSMSRISIQCLVI